MRRRIQGLGDTSRSAEDHLPDGLFLVRVDKAQYRWYAQKPFFILRLCVLEPEEFARRVISGRAYCTAKALWKLGWFLPFFGEDAKDSSSHWLAGAKPSKLRWEMPWMVWWALLRVVVRVRIQSHRCKRNPLGCSPKNKMPKTLSSHGTLC